MICEGHAMYPRSAS